MVISSYQACLDRCGLPVPFSAVIIADDGNRDLQTATWDFDRVTWSTKQVVSGGAASSSYDWKRGHNKGIDLTASKRGNLIQRGAGLDGWEKELLMHKQRQNLGCEQRIRGIRVCLHQTEQVAIPRQDNMTHISR